MRGRSQEPQLSEYQTASDANLHLPSRHSTDRCQDSPIANSPLGIVGAITRAMVELHNDTDTNSDPLAALTIGARAMELVLGEQPGEGVKVTHFSTTPQLHLADTPLASTLKELGRFEANLGRYLTDYQLVSGVTPSRTALSVLSIFLRKMNRGDREVCAAISDVCADAKKIDLTVSENLEWSRSTQLKVAGLDVVLDVSLTKLSHAYRALVGATQVDVPPEDRGNKVGFHITLRLVTPTETEGLRLLKAFERQAVAIPGLLAPIIGTEVALNTLSIPSTVASLFSYNTLLSSVVNDGVHLACLLASGYLAFGIYMRLTAFRASRGKDTI